MDEQQKSFILFNHLTVAAKIKFFIVGGFFFTKKHLRLRTYFVKKIPVLGSWSVPTLRGQNGRRFFRPGVRSGSPPFGPVEPDTSRRRSFGLSSCLCGNTFLSATLHHHTPPSCEGTGADAFNKRRLCKSRGRRSDLPSARPTGLMSLNASLQLKKLS